MAKKKRSSRRPKPKARNLKPVPARKRRAMGKLRSMRNSDSFRTLVLDNLSGIGDVMPRPMFGGLGLYCRGVFFGIVAADVLYLKADDELRVEFERAGATAFKPFADRPMSMKYYSVPPAILESPSSLVSWAGKSLAIASRG